MPYIVTEVKTPNKRKTIYTISSSYDNLPVGKVIVHGRLQHWAFTSVTGTQIPARTHARQINGMRDAVNSYLRNPHSMPDAKPNDLWGDLWDKADTVKEVPATNVVDLWSEKRLIDKTDPDVETSNWN
jgi:hypothetical protein